MDSCIIRRRKWTQKAKRTEDGRTVPVEDPKLSVGVCGTPLFTEREKRTHVCGSCHEGYEEHERIGYNVFADETEKQYAAHDLENNPLPIMPGDRVIAGDNLLFKNDKDTPPSFTHRPATVLCRYGEKIISRANICYDDYGNEHGKPEIWLYPDLVDLKFDHRGYISRGHFTTYIELIEDHEIIP